MNICTSGNKKEDRYCFAVSEHFTKHRCAGEVDGKAGQHNLMPGFAINKPRSLSVTVRKHLNGNTLSEPNLLFQDINTALRSFLMVLYTIIQAQAQSACLQVRLPLQV